MTTADDATDAVLSYAYPNLWALVIKLPSPDPDDMYRCRRLAREELRQLATQATGDAAALAVLKREAETREGEIRAEAWDEGWNAGRLDGNREAAWHMQGDATLGPPTPNPYRSDP